MNFQYYNVINYDILSCKLTSTSFYERIKKFAHNYVHMSKKYALTKLNFTRMLLDIEDVHT